MTVRFLLTYCLWSPEQICERLRLETDRCVVGTSTIYRALDNGIMRDTARYYLRIKYKRLGKSKKKSRKCFAKSITLRPDEANRRARLGDWEGDTVLGHNERPRLVTLVDRKARYTLIGKVDNAEAETINETVTRLLRGHVAHSITFDQGSEFAFAHQLENELNTHVFFAHPHSPWERPSNENTNGLIRQFVPKRTPISPLTHDDVSSIAARLNLRPRKCLGWKTPYEIFFHSSLHFS